MVGGSLGRTAPTSLPSGIESTVDIGCQVGIFVQEVIQVGLTFDWLGKHDG